MVFNIIYELIFLKTNYNFGFRPNKSPQNEINRLKYRMDTTTCDRGREHTAFDEGRNASTRTMFIKNPSIK